MENMHRQADDKSFSIYSAFIEAGASCKYKHLDFIPNMMSSLAIIVSQQQHLVDNFSANIIIHKVLK